MAQIFASDRRVAASQSATARRTQRDSAPENALATLQARADQSAATARLAQLRAMEQAPLQRIEEEEMLQGKGLQRMEDEELLQGKAIDTPVQQQEAGTPSQNGLPSALQSGIEQMSGHDLGGVNVHYNSAAPAAVSAHAFAQGNDIHLASGQERHLPHEAWHVVQQREGRVQPTTDVSGTPVNDDPALETEADVMGAKASQLASKSGHS